MPNPTKEAVEEMIKKVIEWAFKKLDIDDHIPDISSNKATNKSRIEAMWDEADDEVGSFVLSYLEDNTDDVSEWVSDLFGAVADYGTSDFQFAMNRLTKLTLAYVASENDWSESDYYTEDFCEEVYGLIGSSKFERDGKKECKEIFEPHAEEKIEEAYDDWWSGEYGDGA